MDIGKIDTTRSCTVANRATPVYPQPWHECRPANPATLADFEEFCAARGYRIARRAVLRGDWHTPCKFLPNLLAGYALYDLAR